MTPQRQLLLQILAGLRHHPTADELYRRAVKRLPSVSPATVYRNLQTLVRAGVLSVLQRAGSAVRYDPNPEEHHHFVCRRCRRLFDVYLTDVDVAVNFRRSGIAGARIEAVRVELAGLCPRCRAAGPA
jgi:Fur family peroxide stress response transcriptional regulator